MGHTLTFFKEFVTKPRDVGSIIPSSKVLAEVITDAANVQQADTVVEFGPGTGVVTEVIAKKIGGDTQFLALETSQDFVHVLREQCPEARIIHDSAANTRQYLEELGLDSCDCIVSGLPWAGFDEPLQEELLQAIVDVLKPGGRFVTYTYIYSPKLPGGKRFRGKLEERFSDVGKTQMVWRNVPPAFAYYATK